MTQNELIRLAALQRRIRRNGDLQPANQTLLHGFSKGRAPYPPPPKPRDWRYCNQSLDNIALPFCPCMEKSYNDPNHSFDELFSPPDWTQPPQPETDREHRNQLIDRLEKTLAFWIAEAVRPDETCPVFWFYAYRKDPCENRVFHSISLPIDALIQSTRYEFPAIAAELKKLGKQLLGKAREWDDHARLMQGRGYVKTDAEGADTFNPVMVKQAAAVLRGELQRIRHYLESKSEAKVTQPADGKDAGKPYDPKNPPIKIQDFLKKRCGVQLEESILSYMGLIQSAISRKNIEYPKAIVRPGERGGAGVWHEKDLEKIWPEWMGKVKALPPIIA